MDVERTRREDLDPQDQPSGKPAAPRRRWVAAAAALAVGSIAAVPRLRADGLDPARTGPTSARLGNSVLSANYGLAPLPIRGGVPIVDLGPDFGPFEVTERSTWGQYDSGSVALLLHLRSTSFPGAGLSGTLHLAAPLTLGAPSEVDRLLIDPSEPWVVPEGSTSPGMGYASLECRLLGGGGFEGLRVELERLPESFIRRGEWTSPDGLSSPDAVFGHFRWSIPSGAPEELGLPAAGEGSLAFQLQSTERR